MDEKNASFSETQIKKILNDIPIGIMVLDGNNEVLVCNNTLLTYLNLDSIDLLCTSTIYTKIVSTVNIFKSQNNKEFEIKHILSPQNTLLIHGTISDEDIIIKVEPEIASEEVEAESVQAILEGQENERRRIGREIHDGVGPMLSFIKLSFDSVLDEISDTDFKQPEVLKSISETIDLVAADLRVLSHKLVPRTLDEFGLYSAFHSLLFKLNESRKANFEFYSNLTTENRFVVDLELSIYRCAQELLNNAIKYAKASHILVQIILHKQSIILMVEDDGVGFDMSELEDNHQGIGLTNVETRVRLLDGEFNIDSVKGRGTVVSIEIPLT
ncbi:sensor histidine kinase [Labilibacter marinus]|uniref:sensor histidine kinase n=1 Tax=Labilibacter marinus TaxID=1477105 RepID=UPI00095026D2|nr:sensor histidine kinase [Labilibacter marinus]